MSSRNWLTLPAGGSSSPRAPARTSHLVRLHIFLVHVTGLNRSLTVSLCRIFGLIDHARIVFITVLHGDHAGASFTLNRSTAIRPTAPCEISEAPSSSSKKPHDIVVGHKPTLLATKKDREGTLSTCTPYNLLRIIYIGPPVQSDILNLAEVVSC